MEKIEAGYKKAVEALEKQKATIERHKNTIDKKIAQLVKLGVSPDNLEASKWNENGTSSVHYYEICNIGWKREDLKNAYKKLAERERIVSDWAEKLKKAKEKNDQLANLPQIIIEFGKRYKQCCIDWYMSSIETIVLKLEEAKNLEYKERQKVKAEICKLFGNEFLELARMNIDEQKAKIETICEKRKNDLLELLIYRVKEKVGEITNAGSLHIGMNGEINGTVIGDKGTATINTIGAGGYNIQCFHFRVLVK